MQLIFFFFLAVKKGRIMQRQNQEKGTDKESKQ
jgi:hypothetical protein